MKRDEQLELFPSLPPLRRPRCLRLMGFELELLERDAAELRACQRQLDQKGRRLAAAVADGKAIGYVPPEAYGVVVSIEDLRAQVAAKLHDIDEVYRAIESNLAKDIERVMR